MWILVVEDEPSMAELLRQGLEESNHSVTLAGDGLAGLNAAQSSNFDIIILDIMMPGLSGLEITRKLRAAHSEVPILMLTARDGAPDIIKGLDAGADDYLTKPFSLRVLLARIRAISRRATRPLMTQLEVGDLCLDPVSRQVARAGHTVNLTATEFRLLEFLMRRAGRAVARSAIIEGVWGFDTEVGSNTVDVYIKFLREKLDTDPKRKLIHTIRGHGYIMRDDA